MQDIAVHEEVHDIICRAEKLIAQPNRWTQKVYSKRVQTDDHVVMAYCAVGAVRKILYSKPYDNNLKAVIKDYVVGVLASIINPVGPYARELTVTDFNDRPGRKQKEIVALFEKACKTTKVS